MQFGVPTVVESAVLVNEALDIFIGKLQEEARSNDYLNELKENDNYEEIKEALNPRKLQHDSNTKRNRRAYR